MDNLVGGSAGKVIWWTNWIPPVATATNTPHHDPHFRGGRLLDIYINKLLAPRKGNLDIGADINVNSVLILERV